jgi:translation initiation factor IF-3
VISDEGGQLGIMGTDKAMAMAKEQGLDLIEMAPNANPPVCKILDYGKFLYKQQKAAQKQKKGHQKTEVKGVRIGFRTSDHDIGIRMNQARKFLEKRHTVKVQMLFKGRELAYIELGKGKLLEFVKALSDISKSDGGPKKHGHTLVMILTPL